MERNTIQYHMPFVWFAAAVFWFNFLVAELEVLVIHFSVTEGLWALIVPVAVIRVIGGVHFGTHQSIDVDPYTNMCNTCINSILDVICWVLMSFYPSYYWLFKLVLRIYGPQGELEWDPYIDECIQATYFRTQTLLLFSTATGVLITMHVIIQVLYGFWWTAFVTIPVCEFPLQIYYNRAFMQSQSEYPAIYRRPFLCACLISFELVGLVLCCIYKSYWWCFLLFFRCFVLVVG